VPTISSNLSQELADSVLGFIKDNQYIFSIAGTSISFLAGWHIAKSKIDANAIREHYKDIKSRVIEPLIVLLRDDSEIATFPSIRDLSENSQPFPNRLTAGENHVNKHNVDSILLDDLLLNHYPVIKKHWNDLYIAYTAENKEREKIDNIISGRLKADAIERGINCQIHHSSEQDVLDSVILAKLLRKSLQSKGYTQDLIKFSYDKKTISFELNDPVAIYSFVRTDNYGEILVRIKGMCTAIASATEIVKLAEHYDILANDLTYRRKKLESELDIIYRKTNLRVVKHLGRRRCKFIKVR
jgi:hypothetical protein